MERCDLYDANARPTGQTILRGEPVPKGYYRLIAGVLCMHRDGTVLLVQRHYDKPTHPGLFEASASGSVLAGETAAAAAKRELFEETGIVCEQLSPLYEERSETCIYQGFLAQVDHPKQSVRLQEGETIAFRWATKEELSQLLRMQPSPVILHRSIIRYLQL